MNNATVEFSESAADYRIFRSHFESNDLRSAELLGARLVSGQPDRAIDVLTRLALLRRRKGLADDAIAALLQAQDIAGKAGLSLPDWFHSELSGSYVDRQQWSLALATAEAGVDVKPALRLTMARALVKLGRLDEARVSLQLAVHALADDRARAGAIAGVAAMLLDTDHGELTRNIVHDAACRFADSEAFAEIRATVAFLREEWSTAALLHAHALNRGAKATPATLQRLNAMLRGAPAQGHAYAEIFETAVLAAPDNEATLFQWRDFLSQTLSQQEVTARFSALQARSPDVLPALMLTLARRMKHGDMLSAFADQIARWQRSGTVALCQSYLDAVCRFAAPEPALLQRFLAVPELQLRLFFLLRQPRLHVIQIRNPTAEQETLLRNAGVDIAGVQNFLHDLVGGLTTDWDRYLDGAAFASPEAERIVRLDETFTSFQDRIVRDRQFPMIDPLGGGPADLFDSVKIHDRQVFAFRGTELVTFHTGGNMNFALFIHLVRLNVLLLVDSKAAPSKQSFYSADIYLSEVQAVWLRRAARHHGALLHSAEQAGKTRGNRRRVVAIHGRAENPAHHIWNYLSPFERIAQAGLAGNIAAVVEPPTRYFGAIADLYPELASAEFIEQKEAAAIDPCPFSPADIALQLGGSFMPRGLMQRVRHWAERQVSVERRADILAFAHRHPVIWVGLRVGDKVWVNQTAGLARMIDLIVPLYPDAIFLLDGFSLPDGTREVPEKWHQAVQRLSTVAQDIRAACAYPQAVHNLVGNTLSESILWTQVTDAYFTPIGSSQHKVGWYCSAPGLVYTSGNLTKTRPERRQGSWEAEGSQVPAFLIGDIAAPGERRGNHDYRTNLDNIDFAPHIAARRLIALLGEGEA